MTDTDHRRLAPAASRSLGLAVATALMVIVLDGVTKRLIVDTIGPGAARAVISVAGSFIELRYSVNSGIAFGLLGGQATFAGVLAGLVLVPLAIVLVLLAIRGGWWAAASGLVLGGAAGNLIDRIGDGAVTDFIAVGRWPSFNVADAAITTGALILIGLSLMDPQRDSDSDEAIPE